MSISNIIVDKVIERINAVNESSDSRNKKKLIFLKGFPSSIYSELSNKGYESLNDIKWLNTSEYIDVMQLETNKTQLLIKFLSLTREITLGFYEELIAITEVVNDIKTQFDGSIYVLDNNLFDKHYPIDIDKSLIQRTINNYNDDTGEINTDYEVTSKYYSDIIELPSAGYGVVYINRHTDEAIPLINLYEAGKYEIKPILDDYKNIIVKDMELFNIKKLLQQGNLPYNGLQLIIDGENDKRLITNLIPLLKLTNTMFNVSLNNRFSEIDKNKEEQYLYLLKKHWGEDKNFRKLRIYKNPDQTNDTVDISQGHIINDIIDQSLMAIKGSENFRDIFVTAPTGAGKSLLFQIPAIYLAQNENAVTLVITPLIALMRDQVDQLIKERHLNLATFINSDIPYDEKERRISKIKSGEYSVIYLSPELFLANSIESLIGERKVGLLVIDEAHLVTTWGRDFRADYWYLGSYLEKIRKSKHYECKFPILSLTATAVYMGNEDTVNDTVESLNLIKPKIYLGNVRREDITFDIRQVDKSLVLKGFEEFKIEKAKENIIKGIENNIKSIIYCPYTSQVEDVFNSLGDEYKQKVGKYYGSFDKYEKIEAQDKFKAGNYSAMICTKAFGMGVDIKDIEQVYHFAPTGNLADYVQEIGRVARGESVKGIAVSDFTTKDLKYVRMLHGLSGVKQYQLREIIRKIHNIYKEKNSRNLLLTPDNFSFVFGDKDIENKVKNGLLLLAKDLEQKYGFPVLVVRPRSVYTKNFINVPSEVEEKFLADYSSFARLIKNNGKRVIPTYNRNGDIHVSNSGKIYEVNMSQLWEKHFNNLTFPQFKRQFFEGELFQYSDNEKLSPRVNLTINYLEGFETICSKLEDYSKKLTGIFSRLKSKGEVFTKKQFKEMFKDELGDVVKNNELPGIILDSFVADISQNISFNVNSDKLKFIQERRAHNRDELLYRVMNSNYSMLKNHLARLISQCRPIDQGNVFSTYIPISNQKRRPELIYLAIILELFGLASYEVIGGKNTEIFVRVNDPIKLRRLMSQRYTNTILSEIERKRERSQNILMNFMLSDLTDQQRWDLIENYFLGKDDEVAATIGL